MESDSVGSVGHQCRSRATSSRRSAFPPRRRRERTRRVSGLGPRSVRKLGRTVSTEVAGQYSIKLIQWRQCAAGGRRGHGTIEIAWAKLVGQIAQAYGK